LLIVLIGAEKLVFLGRAVDVRNCAAYQRSNLNGDNIIRAESIIAFSHFLACVGGMGLKDAIIESGDNAGGINPFAVRRRLLLRISRAGGFPAIAAEWAQAGDIGTSACSRSQQRETQANAGFFDRKR